MKKSGVELIAEERQKQIKMYGTTECHDIDHADNQLLNAAIYALTNGNITKYSQQGWEEFEENVERDYHEIDNLVKTGALIAAEIDRLQYATENAHITF
jgi:hypothetical protein